MVGHWSVNPDGTGFSNAPSTGDSVPIGALTSVFAENRSRTSGHHTSGGGSTPELRLRSLFEVDEMMSRYGETPERVNSFCKEHPVEAFNIATDILTSIADRTSAMVEESGRALALMEARRERIDRLQAENRRMLDALVAGNAL